MKQLRPTQKWLCSLLAFIIPFVQIAAAPVAYAGAIEPAQAPNASGTIFDLVAIVVDSDINADNNNYFGLKNQYPATLSEPKLGDRIKRYAEDLVEDNELTDTKIILFDKNSDTPQSLANALENLYLNGDGTRNNRLKTVVLVGDIPLPVVNREGNRYVSMFPYTDFEEKAYVYDPVTDTFGTNPLVSFPKPEISHGVIRAPSDDVSGREKLALFFDKNHLYYEGEPEFARFDRKLFFGDLIHEEEQMNDESYKRYLQYLESLEDLAYQRYNKYWANDLIGDLVEEIPFNEDNPANQGPNSFADSLSGDPFASLPDIYTKPIIDQQLIPYYKIFSKYIAKVNDWTLFTGRYKYGDVLSVPALIAMKDEYTKYYLRSVNDALEAKFNEVAEKIAEPLALVDYSAITGNIGDQDFNWKLSEGLFGDTEDDEILFRFHYKNEETGKFYINGIDTDIVDNASARICGMYLGSTKTKYFDADKNFNPKAADGEYSVLTRAMSSDNMATATPLHTIGVNARMLSPAELSQTTDGAYAGQINADGVHETGAIVENNPDYGISAFIENPLFEKDENYKNQLNDFAGGLRPGDVIISVNGRKLSYAYTFRQAIIDSFKTVEKVIDAANKGSLYALVKALKGDPGDLPKDQMPLSPLTIAAVQSASIYHVLAVDGADKILDSPKDILDEMGAPLNQVYTSDNDDDLIFEKGDTVAGLMRIDFYRAGVLQSVTKSFTVELDEETEKIKFASKKEPESDFGDFEDTLVILDPRSVPPQVPGAEPILPLPYDDFSDDTDGVIFTLYRNKGIGYGEDDDTSRAYDNSAGCNAGSTMKNSDRCLAKVATIPVFDPAGATGLFKMVVPGDGVKLMFPENVKKNNQNVNSGLAADYENHVNQFQFPAGVAFEEVDELIYDMCYNGLPTVSDYNDDNTPLDDDSNPYSFPLDPETDGDSGNDDVFLLDYYGRLLRAYGHYVKGDIEDIDWDPSDQIDYVDSSEDGLDIGEETDDNVVYQAFINGFNPKLKVWGNIADIKASQVILNTDDPDDDDDGPIVTLKDFSDHYGLFDGIDNDNDGLTDYEWRDNDGDGVYETKFYDFEEADPVFGIPNANLGEVARKILSHDSEYTVPHSIASFPYKKFDDDITLKVDAHEIGKQLSSVIVHNEPTDYTIMEQIKAQATLSLPIDNPRYLAFITQPKPGPAYPPPNPVGPGIPVGAILAELGNTNPHYSSGELQKLDYLNLFSENIENIAQAKAGLSEKAGQFALGYGSYKIVPGATAADYDLSDSGDLQFLKNKILNEYFDPVVNGLSDDPPSGFDLKIASADKLHDALMWKSMNIDEKHEYILKYYLNDAPNRNAYVNDASVYPAPIDGDPKFGYEGAYLVLEGEEDFFDMSFNKDLPEDKNTLFNPIEAQIQAAGAGDGGAGGGGAFGEGDEEKEFDFVMLPEFIKELQEFLEGFSTVPTFQDSCGFDEDFWNDKGEEGGGEAQFPLNSLGMTVNKQVFSNSKNDQLIATVTGYDSLDKVLGKPYANNEIVTLEVIQDEDAPVFEFANLGSRTMISGVAVFTLRPTGNFGTATLRANSASGISSNSIQVNVTAKKLALSSYNYIEIEGLAELAEELGEALLPDDKDSNDGPTGEGAGETDGASSSGSISGVTDSENGGTGVGDTGGGGTSDASGGYSPAGGISGNGNAGVIGDESAADLENILGALSEDAASGTGAGYTAGGSDSAGAGSIDNAEGSDGGSAGADLNGADSSGETDDPDLTVLTSEPVEEVTLESEPVGEDAFEEEEAVSSETGAGGNPSEKIPEDLNWERYFMIDQYYKKFIDEPEASRLRLLAENFSDRMIVLSPDSVNPFEDALENENSPYIVQNSGQFVADGKSLMKIQAAVYDALGDVDMTNTHRVRFKIEDISVGLPQDDVLTMWVYENGSFKKGSAVLSEEGVAEIYLEAGTKTGKFRLIAEVIDSTGAADTSYPAVSKELDLIAGDPYSLTLDSDSFVLVANNQSKTTVTAILKDRFGNIANNSFATVAFFIDGDAALDSSADQNGAILGTQVISFEGRASVDLLAKDKVGQATIIALLLDYDLEQRFISAGDKWGEIDFSKEIGNTKNFDILDQVSLEFELLNSVFQPTGSLTADGKSVGRIGVKMLHGGNIVEEYSGPVEFNILTHNAGNFVTQPAEKFSHGEMKPANVTFRAGTLAGDAEILVDVPGFVSETMKFTVAPGPAKKIELITSDNSIHTNAQNELTLRARILDEFDNLVDSDNGRQVTFEATEATSDLVEFSPDHSPTVSGVSTSQVVGKSSSGIANIIANSGSLTPGTISLKVNKHLTSEQIKDFSPRALYVSLLGGAFGPVDNGNNVAQTLLYGGQVQAVSTITASPQESKRVLSVDGFGKVEALSDTLQKTVSQATASFPRQKVAFSDKISGEEVASVFIVPKDGTPLILQEKADGQDQLLPIPADEGIYVQRLSMKDPEINFDQQIDAIYISKGDQILAKIDKFGRISVTGDKLTLEFAEDESLHVKDFAFVLSDAGDALSLITFRQNFPTSVKVLTPGSNFVPLPGIYLQMNSQSKKYALKNSFSGSSTNNPLGLYVVDIENELDPAQAPGFGHSSLEKGQDEFGLGFEGNNKHMLLFASGNSVGEAHIPYASDVGIIFGDPMVRVETAEDLVSEGTGYTKDLGRPLFSGKETITELIDFDFNGDDFDDLLLVYENGLVRLLENEISNQRFRDRGYILNIVNGVYSMTKLDVNNDGFDDLLVGTRESCHVDDECIALYENTNGHFERKTLNLNLNKKKAYAMKAADMNSDGCEDVVISDSSGSINVFYNRIIGGKCAGLDTKIGYSNNFGYEIDSGVNLSDQLFIYYPGVEQPDSGEKDYLLDNGVDDDGDGVADNASNLHKFIQFVLPGTEPPPATVPADPAFDAGKYASDAADLQASISSNENVASLDLPPQTYPTEFNFIHLKEDARFVTSVKQAIDINGESAGLGDEILYKIVLKNSGASNINNLIISDATPASMTLLEDSLECIDADCGKPQWLSTGMSLRSKVITGVNVSAGGQRTIQYRMKVEVMPKIRFDVGNDFTVYPSDNNDDYLDILIKPEANPDGVLTYLYSSGLDDKGRVKFKKHDVVAGGPDQQELLTNTFESQGLPDPGAMNSIDRDGFDPENPDDFELDDEVTEGVNDLAAKQIQDTDYNGCNDWWGGGVLESGPGGAAEEVAGAVEGALSALRCSGGGCLPIPYNYAFLAPEDAVPGFPLLAFAVPAPPIVLPVVPFYPSLAVPPSQARVYLTPTLSLGVGGGVCVGPGVGHASPCFPFSLPTAMVPGISDLCGAIQSGIDSAVSFAKDSLVDPALGQATVISDGDQDQTTATTSYGGSFGDSSDPVSAAVNVNVRIPGFPAVITNWIDKQIDEIYNKLLDFPDLYLIYPDFDSIKNLVTIQEQPQAQGQETDFLGLHDFMSKVSSIPLIQIDSREVLLKIPAISPKEIQQIQERLNNWVEYHKKELDRFLDVNCSSDNLPPERRNLCDIVTVDVNSLIRSIERLLDLIDQIANLPRDILNYRYAEAKYATQIICYMDAIITYTGGYFKKQTKIIDSWRKAVEDAIRTFRDWQAILDLVIEYQESCDQCKNDRFSKLGLLMQLFVAIPEPPIIPLPKWPDLVFDFSQIRTGIKIVWPDVVFRPQPVHLPDVPPYFTLPDVLPDINIELPSFEVPEFPEFILPNLPDLPPLPLPKLPDIPRPPKIPALPDLVANLIAMLKPIFKILCLLKNGFILVPEAKLGTEIETLTQPSVQAVLPIIKQLSVQLPPIKYDYVKEIRTNVKLNFAVDTEAVYAVVKNTADLWNDAIKALVENVNKYMDIPYGEIISAAVDAAIDKAYEEAGKALEDSLELDELEESTGIDVDVESSLPLSYTPQDLGFDYSTLYDIQSNVDEIDRVLTEYIATLETDYPDRHYLTASQTFLDPNHPLLNRNIEELERDIQFQDLPDTPEIRQMVAVRDELISYVKDLNNSNILLEQIGDYEEFTKVIVREDQSLDRLAQLTNRVADTETEPAGTTEKYSLLGEAAEEMIKDVALKGSDRLLASVIDFDPNDVTSGEALPSAPPIGFYIVTNTGVNENVLNYTPELKRKTHVLYSDVDHDTDHDIVFSMGGDVYLKENHKSAPDLPPGIYIQTIGNNTVASYVHKGGMSVSGVSSPFENNKKADISWLKYQDAVAYEVVIRKSIYDSFANPYLKYTFTNEELSNPDKPSVSLELENGNYYASIFTIDKTGNKSLMSGTTFLAPQSCADREPPFPSIGASQFDIAIFKELDLDAGKSFDTDGEVVEYYLEMLPYQTEKTDPVTDEKLRTTPLPKFIWSDLNLTVDSNGDGATMNDRDNPKFKIGPFLNEGDIGQHRAILHVVDQSGNSSQQEVVINVFAPEMTLEETFSRTSVATGESKPTVPVFPFSLMRNRYIYRVVDEELKLVPRIDEIKEALTKENGSYEINDFNLDDMILVENADKEIVAEVDPKTGNIGALAAGYSSRVVQATVPTSSTHVQILGPNGELMGTIYLVADPNIDVKVHQALSINTENYTKLSGVNVDDVDIADEFRWVNLPADDRFHPGGAILVNMQEEERLLIIDTAGNILILDKGISITQKQNDHENDPLIIEVRFSGVIIAEIYIAAGNERSHIVGPNDVPFATPRTASIRTLYSDAIFGERFRDLPVELQGIAAELHEKGVLDVGAKVGLDPADTVSRKEFTRALIKLLCIIPRAEAYQNGTEYTDVPFDEEFFPYIKEGTLLGLVEGYKGEPDPSTGLLPFKPNNTITRAEAVKIILEALEMQVVIDLSSASESEPWYEIWMDVAQDLSPYFTDTDFLVNNFIVTPSEAAEPNRKMTFGELMLMSERVLNFYNCFEIDDDGDGMSDYCEARYGIDEPKNDEDLDDLLNEEECFYGLDPTDQDTDLGGVFDGDEIDNGTNGLDPIDDSEDDDNDGLSNRAEIMIHGTDYLDPDTDDGGVNDGDEVMLHLTDPLDGSDDLGENEFMPGEEGIYIVPAACNSCPCVSTLLNKADIVPGDIFFPVVSLDYEEYYDMKPKEKTYIFSKGNEILINTVTKQE